MHQILVEGAAEPTAATSAGHRRLICPTYARHDSSPCRTGRLLFRSGSSTRGLNQQHQITWNLLGMQIKGPYLIPMESENTSHLFLTSPTGDSDVSSLRTACRHHPAPIWNPTPTPPCWWASLVPDVWKSHYGPSLFF